MLYTFAPGNLKVGKIRTMYLTEKFSLISLSRQLMHQSLALLSWHHPKKNMLEPDTKISATMETADMAVDTADMAMDTAAMAATADTAVDMAMDTAAIAATADTAVDTEAMVATVDMAVDTVAMAATADTAVDTEAMVATADMAVKTTNTGDLKKPVV